jgi:hypothetical protein
VFRVPAAGTRDDVSRVLDWLAGADEDLPDYACLVSVGATRGSLVATDTSVKIRPLL